MSVFVILFLISVQRYYGSALSEPYNGPNVKTPIPGPKSQKLLSQLNALQVKIVNAIVSFDCHCCHFEICEKINDNYFKKKKSNRDGQSVTVNSLLLYACAQCSCCSQSNDTDNISYQNKSFINHYNGKSPKFFNSSRFCLIFYMIRGRPMT